jgi:hypothetical protein
MRRLPLPGLCAAALLAAAVGTPAAAQLSVGLEGGITSVVDRTGAQPSAGITLLWAVGEHVVGAFSYQQWFPEERTGSAQPAEVTGDRGITLLGYARIVRSPNFLVLVGGGLGQYERLRRIGADDEHEYEGALTASTMLMAAITARTALYLRGDVATPTGEWEARWGSVHLGLSVPIF